MCEAWTGQPVHYSICTQIYTKSVLAVMQSTLQISRKSGVPELSWDDANIYGKNENAGG